MESFIYTHFQHRTDWIIYLFNYLLIFCCRLHPLSSIQIVCTDSPLLFYCLVVFYHMDALPFIHSLKVVYIWGLFSEWWRLWSCAYRFCVNIHFPSGGQMVKSAIARSHANGTLSFIRNCLAIFQSSCRFSYVPTSNEKVIQVLHTPASRRCYRRF